MFPALDFMRHILVPLDFSDNSLNALVYAVRLFDSVACKFHILHAVESRMPSILEMEYGGRGSNLLSMKPAKVSRIDGLLEEVVLRAKKESTNSKHKFEAISIAESLVTAINTVAISREIDIIIMAATGDRGVKEVFLGHGAIRIIQGVDYWPILVVPQNCKYRHPSQIVFSTTLKRAFNGNELNPLLQLAKFCNANIRVLQLLEDKELTEQQKAHREMLKNILAGTKHDFQKLDVYTSETSALQAHTETTDSDMLALINHRYNFLVKLTQKSVVKKVTFSSPIPILILPEQH